MKPEYLRPGFDFALAHAIEEAGEFLAAAGKTQRWGRLSTNPELPAAERETNAEWLRREMRDLQGALTRLNEAMIQDPQRPDSPDHALDRLDALLSGEEQCGRGAVSIADVRRTVGPA